MSLPSPNNKINNNKQQQQSPFTRQAVILRKNLLEWDRLLHSPRGEDWPTMVGRLNAAYHQTSNNLNKSIEDVYEHFVYVPKQATANPQDIPFFLSTRLETKIVGNTDDNEDDIFDEDITGSGANEASKEDQEFVKDPVKALAAYEARAMQLAAEYEENMVKF